jgi:peptidoglycan/xylan/chitin deacetylase (PgdA/CDA1 family)
VGGWLDSIRAALDGAVRPAEFFFRADDVGWNDGDLWSLLDLFTRHSLAVDLAVIPNELTVSLARRLRAAAESSPYGVGFHQHGFAHLNHEPTGRKYEFGPSRPIRLQRRDIAEGQKRLLDLLGSRVDPIFTPPWNRCTRTTALCLAELGFRVLSREARAAPLAIPGLVELPVSIDWFAHRKRVRLSPSEFGELVSTAIVKGGPVGVMLHHAVMSADEQDAAGELLALISQHPMAAPSPMRALAAVSRPATQAEQ